VCAAICQQKVGNWSEIHNQSEIIEEMKWVKRFDSFEREIYIWHSKRKEICLETYLSIWNVEPVEQSEAN
jgi:hypothetical protein